MGWCHLIFTTKYLTIISLREGRVTVQENPVHHDEGITVVCGAKPEAAGHSVPTVRKQRDEYWYSTGFLLFILLRNPALGRVPDMLKVGQPTYVSLRRIIF